MLVQREIKGGIKLDMGLAGKEYFGGHSKAGKTACKVGYTGASMAQFPGDDDGISELDGETGVDDKAKWGRKSNFHLTLHSYHILSRLRRPELLPWATLIPLKKHPVRSPLRA